jgi:hypothetical protein
MPLPLTPKSVDMIPALCENMHTATVRKTAVKSDGGKTMKTEFNVIRYDYSAALPLGNIQKSVELAFEEENDFHDKAAETVATFPSLPEAESFAREQAAACALVFTGFDGDRAEWHCFYVQEVNEDGDLVDEHGGWGITVEDIRRSLEARQALECAAIDFAKSCTSDEDPDGLTVIGDPLFHNSRWMMEVEGINDSRYIGLNASGEVEFAEY